MGVYKFEDLRVWQAAKRQSDRVGGLIKRPKFRSDEGFCHQLSDAALSVMNNISEGFLRRRDKELSQFLRFAATSNAEVRSCYYVAQGRDYMGTDERDDLLELNDSIGRMIRRFQQSLE